MDEEQRALLLSRLSTAQPPALTPVGALKNYWLKAFRFSGRATRAEYNWALLAYIAGVYAIAGTLIGFGLGGRVLGLVIGVPLILVLVVPWIALIARRCHDLNQSGAFGFLMLVPVVGFILTEAYLMFGDSDPEGARFDRSL